MKMAADKNIYNPHIGYINIGGLPCWPCVTCFGNHNCWNWFCLDASPFNSHLLQDSWKNMKENEHIPYLCFFLDIHFCNRLISYIPYLTWLFREGRAFHSPSGWLGQDVRPADGAGGAAPPGVSGEDQGSGASEGPWGSLGPWGPLVGNHHYFFFYASRSSMNRQFSSIFHCYTLNFRRLSMIDPTGEGFFTVKSDDVVAAFAAGDCRCVQKYQLGFLLIQFVHCLSFVNVCNHFAFVQPYIIWLHVWTYGHVDTLLFISYGLQSKFW